MQIVKLQISKSCSYITDYVLKHTHGEYPDLSLEQANLLEVRAVMVVSIEFRQLSAVPNVAREDPDARQVRVQLGTEDDDALLRQSLQSQSCV
jgi:hypothetical protein